MVSFDERALAALGLTAALARRARALDASAHDGRDVALARITEIHREMPTVDDGRGRCRARIAPRLARRLQDDGDALVVGDWVALAVDAFGDGWIAERVPPTSRIVRRDGNGAPHAVVSNVDTALLVMGLDDDFSPRRLERYFALVAADDVEPVVVLTKRDVAAKDPIALETKLAALRGRVPPTIAIAAVDATQPSAADALAPYCAPGRTLVLLGSSGAGKSTLTNTLIGDAVQSTGAVRADDSRGRHTTTARSLHRLAGGACVIDTPGLRALRPDADEAAVAGAFADIEGLATRCRFRDCRHGEEPGCAVREGVGEDRLRNYHKLLREIRRDVATPLDRAREVAAWKVRGRAVRQKMKLKRGEPL